MLQKPRRGWNLSIASTYCLCRVPLHIVPRKFPLKVSLSQVSDQLLGWLGTAAQNERHRMLERACLSQGHFYLPAGSHLEAICLPPAQEVASWIKRLHQPREDLWGADRRLDVEDQLLIQ